MLFHSCKEKEGYHFILEASRVPDYPEDSISFHRGKVVAYPSLSGDSAVLLDSANRFGLVFDIPDAREGERYDVSVYRAACHPLVSLVADGAWGNHFIQTMLPVDSTPEGWQKLALSFLVPDSVEHRNIRFYAFNPTASHCYVDRLEIHRHRGEDLDFLPDYSLYPMIFELLNDYHLRYYHPLSLDSLSAYARDSMVRPLYETAGIPMALFIKSFEREREEKGYSKILKKLHQMRARQRYPSVSFEHVALPPPGYTSAYIEEMFCTRADTARVIIRSPEYCKRIALYRLVSPAAGSLVQILDIPEDSVLLLPCLHLRAGIYTIALHSKNGVFRVPLFIRKKRASRTVLLAPYTTWQAYNTWGGKSFYKNGMDRQSVHFLSTRRPINSLKWSGYFDEGNHSSLLQVYQWFEEAYGTDILPDYWLEAHPEVIKRYETAILFAHCEYFSPGMFETAAYMAQHKKLISLGGNQMYWKVRWHRDFTLLECRKDGDFFDGSDIPGGMWRNTLTSEARILGVAFTKKGYGTYAPYEVLLPEHPLFEGTGVSKGSLFGMRGFDSRGISGDEMDQISRATPPQTDLLAKGTNPEKGGGCLVFLHHENGGQVLSCGSINSGSGLGIDPVFTRIIMNFMQLR